mgnify:CR=1 FL=1
MTYVEARRDAIEMSKANPSQTARIIRLYEDDRIEWVTMLGPGPLADGGIGEIGASVHQVFYRGVHVA